MPTEKKAKKVAEIQEELGKCTIAIATSYVGINANDMTSFRQRLREQNVEYMVVKNTLARLAAGNTGKEAFKELLQGPTGVAFGYGEETVPARILTEFVRTSKSPMRIIGGLAGNRILTVEDINTLAFLPSKKVLLGRLLGQMNAPISMLVGVLSANLRNLVGVLDARLKQLEAAPAAEAPQQ